MHALLPLIAAGLLTAADAREDEARKELEKLQGKWLAVEFERDGDKVAEKDLKDSSATFAGNRVTMRDGASVRALEFKLDPSKKPKTIELTTGQQTVRGIYGLDGDSLKLCVHLGDPESTFPTEFTGKKGYLLIVLKREKK
jgi:uncharacterized protein (TIGR03067 family)